MVSSAPFQFKMTTATRGIFIRDRDALLVYFLLDGTVLLFDGTVLLFGGLSVSPLSVP
jgi:hypothetical protein